MGGLHGAFTRIRNRSLPAVEDCKESIEDVLGELKADLEAEPIKEI